MKRNRYLCSFIVVLLSCLITNKGFSQITLTSDSLACGATSVVLHGTVAGTTPIASGLTVDDYYSDSIAIGFTFNFYGKTYDHLLIGANGNLCFTNSLAGGTNPWSITAVLAGNSNIYNSICGPYCDIYVPAFGSITYSSDGTAPYRRFCVNYCHDAMFDNSTYCVGEWTTSQIIIYETTNIAEVHIGHKTICTGWNGGYAIVGVQNSTGSASTAAPSRDYPTTWSATDEGWRFTPSASFSSYTCSSITYAPLPFASSTLYWYDSTTGAYLGSGNTISAPLAASGISVYKAIAVGCDDTATAYIDVVPPANPLHSDFTLEPRPGCFGDSIILINMSTPPGYTSTWDFGDGSPLDGTTNPIHVYGAQGTYTVTLAYSGINTCVDTMRKTVTFNHAVTAGFTTSTSSVCLGAPITFTNSSTGGGLSYLWSFGDGTTSTDLNPVHNFVAGGTYDVKLKTTDSIPCNASADEVLHVVSVNVDLAFHDTTVCLREPMPLHSKLILPDTSNTITYQWSPGTNITDPTSSLPYFSGVGDYTYTLTVTANPLGCTSSDVETIHSQPPIVLTNVTSDAVIKYGSSIQLNADGAWIYLWSPDDGSLSNPNINNPVATPTDSITKYTVIGQNAFGCKDTATVTVRVDPTVHQFVPTGFTPNGDGNNDVFKVTPLTYQKLVDFRVFNRWGKEVFQTTDSRKGWDGTFNGEPQDIGTYFYQIILAYPDGEQKTLSGDVTLIR